MSDRTNIEVIDQDEDSTALALPSLGMQQLIAHARSARRDIKSVVTNITTLATLDEESASECLYALVRRRKRLNADEVDSDRENKAIEGPSIRLAEIAAQCFGNCVSDAYRVRVDRTDKVVIAQGIFYDAETNAVHRTMVSRSIRTAKGGIFSDDMINVTSQAAISIARRNAILGGIPRGIYRPAYMAARAMVAGSAQQLPKNREKALSAFAAFGVTPQQIFDVLGVRGEGELGLEHIATLRGMFSALKNAEATVEEMFPPPPKPEATKTDTPPATGDAPAEASAPKRTPPKPPTPPHAP